jgi:hypothetical protein
MCGRLGQAMNYNFTASYSFLGNHSVSEILAFGDRLLYSPFPHASPLLGIGIGIGIGVGNRDRESGSGIGIDSLAGR